jgi:N-acetylglucosamine-6-phosphate deacetylase
VAGAHLEGPFLAKRFRGVHRADCLVSPASTRGRAALAVYRDPAVRLVTLAPELPGALDLVRSLAARRPRVTVSLGHSGAAAEVASEAVGRGARCVTHLFNAMAPLHHREPGMPGWALVDRRVRLGLIADGMHVAPPMLALVARAAAERVVLVTDASPAAGAKPGRYEMAGAAIRSDADGRVTDFDGTLAGSSMTLDRAVRNWSEWTGVALPRAIAAASERPARLVGLPAGLRPGHPADLVLMSAGGQVERTMKRGAWVGG